LTLEGFACARNSQFDETDDADFYSEEMENDPIWRISAAACSKWMGSG
jgi:hypothetical protein